MKLLKILQRLIIKWLKFTILLYSGTICLKIIFWFFLFCFFFHLLCYKNRCFIFFLEAKLLCISFGVSIVCLLGFVAVVGWWHFFFLISPQFLLLPLFVCLCLSVAGSINKQQILGKELNDALVNDELKFNNKLI